MAAAEMEGIVVFLGVLKCSSTIKSAAPDRTPNQRLERTRHERTSLLSCVGEPLKRSCSALRSDCEKYFESNLHIDCPDPHRGNSLFGPDHIAAVQ